MSISVATGVWWPNLNPAGPASLIAVGVVGLVWLLADWPALARFRVSIIFIVMISFTIFFFVSAAPILVFAPLDLGFKHRRYPDMADYLANYIFLSACLIFSLKLVRRPGGWVRDVALVLSVVWSIVILAEIIGRAYVLSQMRVSG